MKRKAAVIAACVTVNALLFTGCSYFPALPSDWNPSFTATSAQMTQTAPTETTAPDRNEEAVKAYADFILGKIKVSTSGCFEKDGGKSYLDLAYGTFNLDELKKALRFDAASGSKASYAILDCGGDGVGEMALSFDSLDHTQASVICLIGYEDGNLVMNSLIEENVPGEFKVYESGYLKSDTMPFKGVYKMVLIKGEDGGKSKEVFTFGDYLGPMAAEIVKHLSPEESIEGYHAIPDDFLIREYVSAGITLVSVGRYSPSEDQKSYEENFVSKLKSLGAEEITDERMNALTNTKDFTTKEVKWTDCTGEGATPSTSAGIAEVAGKFSINIYPDPNIIEYTNLGNVVYVLNSGEGTDMRFTADTDDVTVILEKGSWDMNIDSFAPEKEVFNIKTKIGTIYQFNCVAGDIFPYYRLRAVKGNYSTEWLVLKSKDGGMTVLQSSMKGTE